jgi:hypothetical protein
MVMNHIVGVALHQVDSFLKHSPEFSKQLLEERREEE